MKINMDKVPSTVEEAVDMLVESFDDDDRAYLGMHPAYSVHHTAGMGLRNAWSLWEPDSPLKRDAVDKYGIAHPDDISGLMFSWAVAKVRSVDFDPLKEVERYHKHWKEMGTDSLAAGGWPPKEDD